MSKTEEKEITPEKMLAVRRDIDLFPYSEGKKFDLERITYEVRFLAAVNTQSVIALGKRFIWAKEELKHGEFLKWLEGVGFGAKTVERYMMVAERLASSKFDTVSNLPLTKVYALLELPDEELMEFEAKGSILGKSRDEIDRMTATELRELARKQLRQLDLGRRQLLEKNEALSRLRNCPADKLPYEGTPEEKEAHLKLREIQIRAGLDFARMRNADLGFSRQLQGEILGLSDWFRKQIAELQYDLHKRYSRTDYPPDIEKDYVERIPEGRDLFKEDMDRFERKKKE